MPNIEPRHTHAQYVDTIRRRLVAWQAAAAPPSPTDCFAAGVVYGLERALETLADRDRELVYDPDARLLVDIVGAPAVPEFELDTGLTPERRAEVLAWLPGTTMWPQAW
jgi:hypothetical protein